MSLVMMNLVLGLAVSDISELEKVSKVKLITPFVEYIMQAHHIYIWLAGLNTGDFTKRVLMMSSQLFVCRGIDRYFLSIPLPTNS